MIKYEELPEWELTSDYGVETAPGVPPPGSTSNLVSIAGTPGANIGCSDPQCVEQCANGFKAAVAKMKAQGYTVSLGPGSCHRSVAAQNTNPSALKCKCKDANCSNCPHVRGVALDVTCSQEKVPWSKMRESGLACKGKPACQGQFATRSDYNCQNLLIKAMRESGMCKLYFEDWHFQPKGTSGACF
jgi:D-alanyl-D-alanine dipeptidase